jgi:hypothetical protein
MLACRRVCVTWTAQLRVRWPRSADLGVERGGLCLNQAAIAHGILSDAPDLGQQPGDLGEVAGQDPLLNSEPTVAYDGS